MTNISTQAYHTSKQISDILDEEFMGNTKLSSADLSKVNSLLNQALSILRFGERRGV